MKLNNIDIQAQLDSGTSIKTINGNNVLGSGDITLSPGATQALVVPPSGYYMLPMNNPGGGTTNTALTANRVTLFPIIFANTFTMAAFAITVAATTPIAGSRARICIYDNRNGAPRNLLYQSTDLDCSTSGVKEVITNYNFLVGVVYWMGVHSNAASNISHIPFTSCVQWGGSSTQPYTLWYQNVTYGTSAPNLFVATGPNASSIPNVVIKIA
jgi:hypothetical protein